MREIILVIDVLSAFGLVALVLLQQGKGADMGAAFGSGASATLFGARGGANFLSRATAVLATIFFLTNMGLAYLAARDTGPKSVTETTEVPIEAPAKPEPPEAPKVPTVPDVPQVPK
jgi:preprotein translocase subunit SecG